MVDGETFYQFIPATAKSVVFEYNQFATGDRIPLSTPTSPVPIYGHLDGTVWHVTTTASTINANPRCDKMFYNSSKLTYIQFGSGFNTSNVKHMDAMFYGCSGLTSLDVSSFNISNVVSMSRAVDSVFYTNDPNGYPAARYNKYMLLGMFAGCSSLTSLDLSSFNTSQVTDMRGLFDGSKNLTSLNVSSFNTSNVTCMCRLFCNCTHLTFLDLSNFDMALTNHRSKKQDMYSSLSTSSGVCTIVCPESVQNSLLEHIQWIDNEGEEDEEVVTYYITDIPIDEVTFTWVRT